MFITLSFIFAGIPIGLLLRNRVSFVNIVGVLTTWSVYMLLFVLGLSLGGNDEVFARVPALGLRSLIVTIFAILGSMICTYFVGRFLLQHIVYADDSSDEQQHSTSKESPIKGSCIILGWFISGVLCGRLGLIPTGFNIDDLTTWALYVLLFLVGISMGFDTQSWRIIRQLHFRVVMVPVATIVGTFLGSLAAWLVLPELTMRETLAIGSGFGYYSLSSIMITNLGNAELGSMALMSNISREIITITMAPLLVKGFGRLAPVSSAGAASMDTCLPVIARFSGERCGIISIFHGMVLTFLVPFFVTAILTW
ncbi:MAG: lysine exporter LysO family protein [Pseudomonadota bacterium]